ncbi:hypothetical protein P43SY_008054 [Pythium insidiosum]|uniref:Ubiquitinyl hydrolase 1 n=1 Tax=Pythium insidiosum TaxID=114742 RepID=A0AAD5LKX3_PYTIN|nr:hypothetical protein P43SY_008054 [Pythium insidiosum]
MTATALSPTPQRQPAPLDVESSKRLVARGPHPPSPVRCVRGPASLDDWSLAELHVLESRVSAALAASHNVVARVKQALRPAPDATSHPFRARHRELLAAVGALPLQQVPRDDRDHDGGDDSCALDSKRRKHLVVDLPAWRRQHFGECADTRLALKRSAFERLFAALQQVPRRAAQRIFEAFDANDSGRVEFAELCDALARLRRRAHAGARDERIDSIFRWFSDASAATSIAADDIELLVETYQALMPSPAPASSVPVRELRSVLLPKGATSLSLREFHRHMSTLPQVISTLVGPFAIIEDVVQERRVLEDAAALRWCDGDTAYLVNKCWWDAWKCWIVSDNNASKEPIVDISPPVHPGPITNAELCKNIELGILRPEVALDHDAVLVSGPIWRKLQALYGGGPELPRKIIASEASWQVDLHPLVLSLRVLKTDAIQTSLLLARRVQLSEATDMNTQGLLRRLGLAAGVNIRDAVLWYRRRRLDTWRRLRCSTSGSSIASPSDGDILLSALGLQNGDEVLIDFRPLESSDDDAASSSPPSFVPDNRLFFRLYRPMGNDFVSLTAGIECGLKSGSRWNAQPLAGIDTEDALLSDSASAAVKSKAVQSGSMHLYVGGHGGLGGQGNVMVNIDPGLTRPRDPARLATHLGARATGLVNLGNTCFINCALQCIGHSPMLREYMLSRRYLQDINKTNPLGTKGKIATLYGKLMEMLWGQTGEDVSCYAPNMFRDEFLRQRPLFQESNQHDSHEFIVALLDTLHEDLNRREDDPQRYSLLHRRRARSSQLCVSKSDDISYTTATSGVIDSLGDDGEGWMSLDSSGSSTLPLSSDATLGSMSWQAHASRNASVIVDLFHGQMRSETVCASCDARKVTFDPFVYFSVPIPDPKWIRLEVKIVFQIRPPVTSPEASGDDTNGSEDAWLGSITPVICRGFWLPRESTVSALFDAVSEAYQVPPRCNRFVLAEVRRCRIARLFDEVDRVQTLGSNRELFVFERATSVDDVPVAPSSLKRGGAGGSATPSSIRGYDDLVVGARADGTTVDDVWYPGTVVNESNAGVDPTSRRIMIHFDGLDATWDTWFSERDWQDGKLAPVHTRSKKETKVLEVQVVMRVVTTHRSAIPMRDESQQPKVGVRNVTNNQQEEDQGYVALEVFGSPMLVTVSSASSTRDLHDSLLLQATRFMTHAFHPGIMDDSLLPFDARILSVDTVGSILGELLPRDDTGVMQYLSPKSVIVLDWRKYTDYSYFEQPSRDYIPQMYAKQLQIEPSNNNSETMRPTSANDAVMLDNSTSLPKCLDELFKRETIEQDDMWMCERCGEQRTGTRQADVWKLPDLVMVQLKRFQYHESGYREKIRTMVDCPLNGLDFSPWVGNAPGAHPDACLYDLYAVVNHVGGLARGHYTAYCRYDSDFEESSRMFTSLDRDRERSSAEMPFTDMWLRFDDEKVVEIAPGDVISDAAYVLFYKRRKMSSRNLLAYSF